MQKKILFVIKAVIVFFVILGLFLTINQLHEKKAYGDKASSVFNNFVYAATSKGPIGWIRGWFDVDPSSISVSKEEEIVNYKLQILSKSLNNYFQSLLGETESLVSDRHVSRLLHHSNQGANTYKIKTLFRRYLKSNLDVMEISLYSVKGEKLTSVKYTSVHDYLISKKVIRRLENQDNVLVKNPANKQLVMISSIKEKDKMVGVVTQSLNPVFFTKILDFLNINDNLFYIKNPNEELVIDNYSAYQYMNESKMSFPYLFYRKLTQSKESTLTLNIDNVDYAIGVIIDENNLWGNVLPFLFILALIYVATLIVSALIKNSRFIKDQSLAKIPSIKQSAKLKKTSWEQPVTQVKKEKEIARNGKSTTKLDPVESKEEMSLHDEIEAEIERIKEEAKSISKMEQGKQNKSQPKKNGNHKNGETIPNKRINDMADMALPSLDISQIQTKKEKDDDSFEINAEQFISK